MKNLLLFVLVSSIFTACNSDPKPPVTPNEKPEMVVAESVEEIPNESDFDLNKALVAFEAGKNEVTASYIYMAISDLQEESDGLPTVEKVQVDKVIQDMQALATKVKKGEIKDLKTLEDQLVQAEMAGAHEFMVFTQIYGEKEPSRAENNLRRAIKKMESASQRLEGTSKKEAEGMIAESKDVLAKSDRKANEIGDLAGKQVEKLAGWLKKNAAKIGLHEPKREE